MRVPGPQFPILRTPPAPSGDAARSEGRPAPARESETAAAGTLWDLLTPDEREYFAEAARLGPLTYGPARRPPDATAIPIGRRIDVKA